MLEKIFEYLTLNQRLTASRTCKKWHQLAFSPKFSRNMRVAMGSNSAPFEDIRAYRNYRNVYVCCTDNPDDVIFSNQSAIGDFFSVAPLEKLKIYATVKSINTLFGDCLLKDLTELEVRLLHHEEPTEKVVKINHPSLKTIQLEETLSTASFEINCPNLTDLSISADFGEEFCRLLVQLQRQLRSLEVHISGTEELRLLVNTDLRNLKKLYLHMESITYGFDRLFNNLVNLVELHLQGNGKNPLQLGEEMRVLKNLSKLKLTGLTIDTAGFEKALRQLEQLEDLKLWQCEFNPSTRAWHIASENARTLTIVWKENCPIMLPRCAPLKSLALIVDSGVIDDVFVQICASYPQLEKLYFNGITSLFHPCGEFRSSSSFSHITKLKLLKELELGNLILKNVNWTNCSAMKIEKLRLSGCQLDDSKFLHSVKSSFGRRLQQLHLKLCYGIAAAAAVEKPSGSWSEIDAKFVESLRKALPWCGIAYDGSMEEWSQPEAIFLGLVPNASRDQLV